jgi:perosamine synthetase
MQQIPIAGPWISQKEVDYVAEAARKAWYADANLYNVKFEKAFAEYLGVKYAISLPSCTSAIHLSLLALGLGPGDEVIVPDVTWIATSAPISYVGATPVFADIDPRTWCLTADSIEECITENTKAVIPVELYGSVPDWDGIQEVARRFNLAVIEDAAEAIGSVYKGRRAGSLGCTGVFSFHGSKTLTTGEGGMLVTDREDLYERALFLRDHGREPGDVMFFNREVAYKYKMGGMQAALGLAQLERIEELVEKKRKIFEWYEMDLSDCDGLQLNYEAPQTTNSYWMVTAILSPGFGLEKQNLMKLMEDQSISCRPFFFPLSMIPAYEDSEQAKRARERNNISYAITPYGVNLPSALSIEKSAVRYVCETLKSILRSHR